MWNLPSSSIERGRSELACLVLRDVGAAISLPARFVMFGADLFLFTKADCAQLRRRQS